MCREVTGQTRGAICWAFACSKRAEGFLTEAALLVQYLEMENLEVCILWRFFARLAIFSLVSRCLKFKTFIYMTMQTRAWR